MRRLLLPMPFLLMPLAAAGQSLAGDTHELANRLLAQKPDQVVQVGPDTAVPLWRGSDGRWLTIKADSGTFVIASRSSGRTMAALPAVRRWMRSAMDMGGN